MPKVIQHPARNQVATALRHGVLTRQPCVRCGDPKSQAHHPDYRKPLEVIWLCRPCHNTEHRGHRPTPRTRKKRASQRAEQWANPIEALIVKHRDKSSYELGVIAGVTGERIRQLRRRMKASGQL